MNRRDFIEKCGLAAGACWYPSLTATAKASGAVNADGPELQTEVCIVGGGLGGCAAAMAAVRSGARVVLTEPTDWIGGQLTQQLVPPDEHRWIETGGCTQSYRRFRNRVRDYYRTHYPLTPAARNTACLNPGNGAVSRLCHEPRVALGVLREMLSGAIAAGRLTPDVEYGSRFRGS